MYANCLLYTLTIYCKFLFFPILRSWHAYPHSYWFKIDESVAVRMVIFCNKFTFWDLNSKWKVIWMPIASLVFSVYNVNPFFFKLSCGIRMHVLILREVENGRVSDWKNGHIVLKIKLLKINFQDECHLYANFLISVLTICR